MNNGRTRSFGIFREVAYLLAALALQVRYSRFAYSSDIDAAGDFKIRTV